MKKYIINNWLIDTPSGSVINQQSGEKKRLGEYQLKLLVVLASHAGKTLSREQLMTMVWENRVIGNNSLPNAIHALRIAIEDDGKEQKIIKTIPKIGYILESEYCQSITLEDENEVPPPEENESNSGDTEDKMESQESSEGPPTPVIEKRRKRLSYLYLIGLSILLMIGYFLYLKSNVEPSEGYNVIIESQPSTKQLYSHIILHEIAPATRHQQNDNVNEELLERKLQDTFEKLNPILEGSETQLYVYFRMRETVLNYDFILKGPCSSEQLSMHIYHWRIDNEKFNDLIYKETTRKLHEMAKCN